MRHFIRKIIFLLTVLGVHSCSSSKKLIEKQPTKFGTVKFYAANRSGENTYVDKVYAYADSNGVKRFYSFFTDKIIMTDDRAKNLSYTITFRKLPDNFDNNIYQKLSAWDSLVFSKILTILKSPQYSQFKNPTGATGYEILINYYHGFPKDKKFQPL